eukprot:gene9335-1422_t
MTSLKVKIGTVLHGTFDFVVKTSEKISEIKKRIEKEKFYVYELQTLVFKGKTLENDKTIEDYKIQDSNYLILLIKMDSINQRYLNENDLKQYKKEQEEKLLDEKTRLEQKKNALKIQNSNPFQQPEHDLPPKVEVVIPKLKDFPIDELKIASLVSMGFSEHRSKKALILNRLDLNYAMDWLLAHIDDPYIDAELTLNQFIAIYQIVTGKNIYQVESLKMRQIKEAVKLNVCTFCVTGPTFTQQKWYFCKDCDLVEHKGCCESCAKTCHKGHNLVERSVSSFYCDCGAGEGSHSCKSLDYEKAKEILNNKELQKDLNSNSKIIRTLTKQQLKNFYNPTGENFTMDEEEEEEEVQQPTVTTPVTTNSLTGGGGDSTITNEQLMNALSNTNISNPNTPGSASSGGPITQDHLNSFFNQFNNQNNQ